MVWSRRKVWLIALGSLGLVLDIFSMAFLILACVALKNSDLKGPRDPILTDIVQCSHGFWFLLPMLEFMAIWCLVVGFLYFVVEAAIAAFKK